MHSSRHPDSLRAQRIRRPHLYKGRSITLAIAALCVAWVTMVHPDCVLGQNPPPNVQYTNKAVDLGLRGNLTVNPSTRAVEIQIPLGSYPGRAGLDVPIAISYSSKVHNIKYYAYNPGHYNSNGVPIGDGYSMVVARFAEYSSAGWTSTVGFPVSDYSAQNEKYDMFGVAVGPDGQCPYSPCLTVDRVLFRMPDGSTHELRSTDQPRFPNDPLIDDYYSVDGARMRYQKSTDTLFLADGSRYLFGQGKYIDRNGNTITSTDTLGRPISYPPVSGNFNGAPGDLPYSIQGVGGMINYTFKWRYLDDPGVLTSPQPLQYVANSTCPYGTGSYSPYLFFGDGGTHTCILNGGSIFRPVVLYQILLPTGQAYTFTYNIYGEIDKVVLPTGGYERYEYAQFGPLTTNMVTPYVQANRGVTRRYVSPSGLPADELPPWQYSGNGGSVSITAPDNSLTILSLYTDPSMSGTFGYSLDQARAGRTYSENFYSPPDGNGARQLLRRHLSDWSVTGSNATSQFPPAQQYATRNARLTKEVEIVLDTGSSALAKTTVHNYELTYEFSIGPIETSVNEYDWVVIDQSTAQSAAIGSIPLGSLLRTQESTNLILDPNISQSVRDAYRARNLVALATSTRVKNPSGTIVAQGSISYDEYSLTPIGSIPSWTDPQTVYRGNATTAGSWLDTTGTYLQTHTYYDQFGNVRTVVDAKGNQSQIDYSSSYQFAYPTTATTAVPDPSGQYASTSPFSITTNYDFNTGKVLSTTDANAKTTSYDYTDYLNRLRQVTLPDTARVRYNYFDTPGDLYVQVLTDQDSSRSIENRKYFDGLGRPTRSFLYDGTASTPWTVTDTYYDNMGRVSQVSNPYRVSSPAASVPPTCSVCTTSVYDVLGRVKSVTSPDSAQVTSSYGALTSGSILGTTVVVTDQAGKMRRSLTDSLGRLVRVDEPNVNGSLDDANGPVQPTSYAYDVMGNLRLVSQGSQQRFFMYDSLGRLIRAKNPEQGNFTADANGFGALTDTTSGISNSNWSMGYIYDANGNLTKRKDARDIVASYGYDALNRNTTLDYSDTISINPDVTRMYDGATNGKGRVWQSYAGGAETPGSNVEHQKTLSYDEMGRPRFQQQRFKANGAWSQNIYETQRQYNLAGGVILQIYPSGHSVTYNYDQAGRLGDKDSQNLAFTGNLGDNVPRTYSRGISYSPFGSIAQEQFGTDTAIYNKLAYNSRGQLAEIKESTTANDSSWDRGKFVNWFSLGCGGAACNSIDNNGNLRKQETFVPKGDGTSVSWYQQYDYDTLNRLQRVHEYTGNTSLDWQQEYVYDRYGNRTIEQDVTKTYGAGINKKAFTVNTANNRLGVPAGQTGTMAYDNAGNLTSDTYSGGAVTRAYDAENRMTSEMQANSFQAGSYTYNADGQRVRRTVGGQPSAVTTWQVYGFDGELLAEYAADASNATPQKEYGYRNGQLLITAEPGAGSVAPVFADDFNDNSLDTSKWSVLYPQGTPPVAEQSQQLQMALVPNTAGYNGVYSSTYDLTGRMVQVEVTQAVSQGGWAENYLSAELDSQNRFLIDAGATSIVFRSTVNGVNNQTVLTYDAALHRHWRVRHDQSSNTVNLETSTDGTVWTTRKSVTPGFALTSLRFYLVAGAWGTGNGSPGTAKYDNFKLLASAQASSSLAVPNFGFESPVVGATGYQYGPAGGSWTFAGGTGVTGNNSAFTGGIAAPEGSQAAFLQGGNTSLMSQSVSGFQPGTNYIITFAAAQRLNCCNSGGQDFQVYLDTNLLGTFHPSASGYFEYSTPTFTTTAGAHTVKFVGLNSLGGDHTAFIDNVRIQGSPAPGFGLEWLVTDQLGTPRMVFDKSGELANLKRHDYLPFGEELATNQGLRTPALGYAADTVRQKFTQKERDNETGLDYFLARYYSSTQGRFTSPDPLMASGKSTRPQSWNRYTYVLNRPLSLADPNGLIWGTQDFEQNGHKYRRYHWFYGNKVGKGFTAFTPDKDGTVIALKGGGGAKIYRNGGQETWPGPGGDGHFNNDNLNFVVSHAHGMASALQAVNPLGKAAVDWAFSQVGGVDRDSALYANGKAIGDGVVGGSLALAAPGLADLGGAGQETTTLFRAVKQPELDDILETATYRVAEGQSEGKYFFQAAEDAQDFGRQMFRMNPGEGSYTVTSAEVDNAVIRASTPLKAAGEGAALFVPKSQLPIGPVKVMGPVPD